MATVGPSYRRKLADCLPRSLEFLRKRTLAFNWLDRLGMGGIRFFQTEGNLCRLFGSVSRHGGLHTSDFLKPRHVNAQDVFYFRVKRSQLARTRVLWTRHRTL